MITRDYLLAHRAIDPTSDCWLWTKSTGRSGYGQTWHDGNVSLVHRIAYTLWIGPIPDGYHIDHVRARGCTHRACFNPAHLEAVTPAENARRSPKPSMTHCPQGHPYEGDNLYVSPGGDRRCRTCKREWARAAYARKTPNRVGFGGHQRAKTHCPSGHPYDEANTRYKRSAEGYLCRICRTCHRQAEYARKHPELMETSPADASTRTPPTCPPLCAGRGEHADSGLQVALV